MSPPASNRRRLSGNPQENPPSGTIMRNDPMTGDDDGDRIRAQGHPHGPRIPLSADANGDPLIGPHAAIGNSGDHFPHFSLECHRRTNRSGSENSRPRTGQGIGWSWLVASSTMAPQGSSLAPVGLRA